MLSLWDLLAYRSAGALLKLAGKLTLTFLQVRLPPSLSCLQMKQLWAAKNIIAFSRAS